MLTSSAKIQKYRSAAGEVNKKFELMLEMCLTAQNGQKSIKTLILAFIVIQGHRVR